MVLVNPLCTIGYTLASWRFFYGRIYYEEATLLSFFGHKYFQYQENVKHTGVPFVPGYIFEKQQQQMNQQEQPPQRRPVEQYQRFDDQSGGSDTQEDASDTN
ncbi:unnamed protein product [Allacma fusca]|uniref:Uncharacterized protein n=1 Tax=Allacma fusca TaxID=39272 RepID=A0A8J2PAY8_9HEXA|nr:unnamed protein product [Allacma fusca]